MSAPSSRLAKAWFASALILNCANVSSCSVSLVSVMIEIRLGVRTFLSKINGVDPSRTTSDLVVIAAGH